MIGLKIEKSNHLVWVFVCVCVLGQDRLENMTQKNLERQRKSRGCF